MTNSNSSNSPDSPNDTVSQSDRSDQNDQNDQNDQKDQNDQSINVIDWRLADVEKGITVIKETALVIQRGWTRGMLAQTP